MCTPDAGRCAYLYLSSVSCCDVGNGPAGFLPDGFLCTAKQVKEAWESRAVQYHLQQSGGGVKPTPDKISFHPLHFPPTKHSHSPAFEYHLQ